MTVEWQKNCQNIPILTIVNLRSICPLNYDLDFKHKLRISVKQKWWVKNKPNYFEEWKIFSYYALFSLLR